MCNVEITLSSYTGEETHKYTHWEGPYALSIAAFRLAWLPPRRWELRYHHRWHYVARR